MDCERVAIGQVLEQYEAYVRMLSAAGFRIEKAAIRRHCIDGLGYRGPMKAFFNRLHVRKHPNHTAPLAVHERMKALREGLESMLRRALAGIAPHMHIETTADGTLAGAILTLSDEQKTRLADRIRSSEHREYVGRREISVQEFQRLLDEFCNGQTVARGTLIGRIQQVLAENGIRMSFDTIEERFRKNTKVRTMPECVKDVFKGDGAEFLTGLVPMETLTGDAPPAEWLECKRRALMFRSDSSMHKAIAEATGLNYDSVHKALSGPRKAKRIQVGIRDCFQNWDKMRHEGKPLGIKLKYRGVPAEEFAALLDRVRPKFSSLKAMYSAVATACGTSPAKVKKYHEHRGGAKYLPVDYRQKTLTVAERLTQSRPASYLNDGQVRKHATLLAELANKSLEAGGTNGTRVENMNIFRHLRLKLIAALKEQRAEIESGLFPTMA